VEARQGQQRAEGERSEDGGELGVDHRREANPSALTGES
jgi:hypothetical protein